MRSSVCRLDSFRLQLTWVEGEGCMGISYNLREGSEAGMTT
jgi:hypothetical protein